MRQVGETDDFAAIEQALITADELLAKENDFQKFLNERKRATEVAQVNARTTAVAELRRTSIFIESYVGANLLSEAVNDLLQLQERIASAEKSGQDEQIFNMQKATVVEIERLKLTSTLASFVYVENSPAQTDVQQAANGIAITESNRELLEGDRNDVLVLGNFTAQAPHLLVDLLGKTTFDGGSVVYCWVGSDTKPPLYDLVLPALRSMGGTSFTSQNKCSSTTAMTSDVMVVERGAFLAQDILEARPVIEAFEAGKLKAVSTILWADAGASAEDDKRLAATIQDEVMGKARVGFGLLRVNNNSETLCMIVTPDDEEFHRRALAIRANDIEKYLPRNIGTTSATLERAFAGVQKNSCSALYASETDMASLIGGLQKIAASYDVVPVWIDRALVEEGKTLALRSEEEKQREIAARRQELEADAASAKKKSEEASVVRARKQEELRQRYSQESRAAYNELASLIKAYVTDGSGVRSELAEMFPILGEWKTLRVADGWATDKFTDELVDYGTADWQGRRLEAVLLKASVTTKNAVRGKYEDACFMLGYLIDSEFDMRRDPIVEPCDEAGAQVSQWQTSRAFESRWVGSN